MVTLAGAAGEVQSTKSIRDIANVWNSQTRLPIMIAGGPATGQYGLSSAIIVRGRTGRTSFPNHGPQI